MNVSILKKGEKMSTTKPLLNGISQALIKAVTYYRNKISPYKGYECGCRTQLGLSSCSQHAQDQLSTQPLSIALKQIKARSVLCRSLNPSKVGFKQGLGRLLLGVAEAVLQPLYPRLHQLQPLK